YPQTTLPNDHHGESSGITTHNANYDTDDVSQPNSSLVQANPAEPVLLRLPDLAYHQHAMQLPATPPHVLGQAQSFRPDGPTAPPYWTNRLSLGPGEARDVLFDAPAYNGLRPGGSDGVGPYNVYYFKNRDWRRLSSLGSPGPGGGPSGMMTEVRVYQGSPLPA